MGSALRSRRRINRRFHLQATSGGAPGRSLRLPFVLTDLVSLFALSVLLFLVGFLLGIGMMILLTKHGPLALPNPLPRKPFEYFTLEELHYE